VRDVTGPIIALYDEFDYSFCPSKSPNSPHHPIRRQLDLRAGSDAEGNGVPGSPEEEATAGKTIYLQVLERLHRELAPSSYLEIGVRHGISLSLARCPALGADPNQEVNRELPETTEVVCLTSDEFFKDRATNVSPDLTFIDGMHLSKYSLRDFMNVERCSPPGAVVVFVDVFPNHPLQANRVRASQVWTGDVWRVADILTRLRSDFLLPIDTAPTGLLPGRGSRSGQPRALGRLRSNCSRSHQQSGPTARGPIKARCD